MVGRLTERQNEYLRTIAQLIDKNGYPPTVREVGKALGIKSSSTVAGMLQRLQRHGLIEQAPERPRTIRLTWAGRRAVQGGGVTGQRKGRRRIREHGGEVMTAKHTPGPWRLNRLFCFNVEDQNGRTIARVNSDPDTYDEAMANARLITAAPDLLKAAEAALALLRADIPDTWRDRVCAQLQTAIAKARGEVGE